MTCRPLRLATLSLVCLTIYSVACLAQDEPEFDELTRMFKKKYLSIGVLFQGVADFQIERSFPGKNGFNISNMRFILSGDLDGGFGYFFVSNVINSPAILDAKAYYALSSAAIFDLGLFKPPFSKEFLTGAGAIDFVNRSQVVTALAGSRQIGFQIRGATNDRAFSYGAGMFNGNSFAGNNNDNNNFMYVGRVTITPQLNASGTKNELEIGVNGAYSKDNNAVIGGGVLPVFGGKRLVFGGDMRFTCDKWLLATEVLGSRLNHRSGETTHPVGYHATLGYMTSGNTQVLLRWDSFRPDMPAMPDQDLLIAGFNLWPTKVTELQVNCIIPTKDSNAKHHQVLVNAQFAF